MALATISHKADFCVIGGGLSGICAAISAARHGAKVVFMQERPMLGGNASSEIRMWVSGAQGKDNLETGILEEIMMENQYRNPDKNYSVWDNILYDKVRQEKNIDLLLNCSCMDAACMEDRIISITGWQMTTQQFHRVEAAIFADCSGDSILAPLTGAPYREGRESKKEFNESIAPDFADKKTMGMSCLLTARETNEAHSFIPPVWAAKITGDHLKYRQPALSSVSENFWYLELGGEQDTIADTEKISDQLQALAYGMWDYLKNDPEQKEKNKNWQLEWVGELPGKRESRRYIGAYTMTENDVLRGGVFDDEVAYGGWTMDDHHPAGFRTSDPPNIFHPAPSPYGIPYGTLYSKTIKNLMFAGRNISVTHAAMSSTRVMGTCALLGQAIGTAAALAAKYGCLPAGIAEDHIAELQDTLQFDDCFLPHKRRKVSGLNNLGTFSGNGSGFSALIDGIDRPRADDDHCWKGQIGDRIELTFSVPVNFHQIRLVMDSDLNRESLPEQERMLKRNMFHNKLLSCESSFVPRTMIRSFTIEGAFDDGTHRTLVEETNNYQRLKVYSVNADHCKSIKLTIHKSWGYKDVRLFAFEVL